MLENLKKQVKFHGMDGILYTHYAVQELNSLYLKKKKKKKYSVQEPMSENCYTITNELTVIRQQLLENSLSFTHT